MSAQSQPSTPLGVRLTDRLEQYWRALKRTRRMPLEEEVQPSELQDIWDYCFVVDARQSSHLAYSYLGKSLIDAYGDDMTGKEIAEMLVYPHPESLFQAFQKVVATGESLYDEGEFDSERWGKVRYRCGIFPLASNNGESVTYLIGGMRWKIY